MTASIYTLDGDTITTGLQGHHVCDEAILAAEHAADRLGTAVHLVDDDGEWLVHPAGADGTREAAICLSPEMTQIDLDDLDPNLRAYLGDDLTGLTCWETPMPGRTVGNQVYHIVYDDAFGRGGIVQRGSGSSGHTEWTDARSATDVLRRYLTDTMIG